MHTENYFICMCFYFHFLSPRLRCYHLLNSVILGFNKNTTYPSFGISLWGFSELSELWLLLLYNEACLSRFINACRQFWGLWQELCNQKLSPALLFPPAKEIIMQSELSRKIFFPHVQMQNIRWPTHSLNRSDSPSVLKNSNWDYNFQN